MKKGRKRKKYVLYKDDKILSHGTIEEIASKMNLSVNTLYFYRTPTYKKRAKKNRFLLIETRLEK